MSPIIPSSLYQSALSEGQYQPDEVQRNTVARLDIIHHDLGHRSPEQALPSSGLKSLLGRLFGGLSTEQPRPIQGLYMWGGVGRGKTWLMDMFFQSLPTDRKLRLHFHRFMLRVHEELTALQGHENPLDVIADGFKAQTDVLCFDEFFVSDITDAMILGTLLEALFKRGITLVATSNIPPDELYRNGLQRARFLPAIEQIKKYCDVMNVDAGIDYRLRTLTQAHLYLTPLSEDNRQEMHRMFQRLAGRKGEPNPVLEINHRSMPAISSVDGVLAITFKTLCEDPRSPLDYIALSKLYHSVLLHDTPAMTALDESAARRFLALVDEFYERHVKLIINAEAPMEQIYQGELLTFEYRRCLSRLQEMQSEEYLKLPHLP
ncbi:putative ATPase, with nucleoside triP hydrolase domain [Xenorhabdus bovienii str. Jollieti]|uniref:Cell division protein ZapE n=1 Tax=Xenorhabdus bovienii (strain SS-2004) TaxID=406818 RepID=D3V5N2_XENBS|nr:cell division protein ZapE [Xenorhabdus bovienii]CBJ82961.1 putative ATPase, with nucleoside triP hydrolase domain [Xenorhabdus bovienii SS-2004]CDH28714.1 putative ATPase, with nucleoside triP hydrolase domain [Xenorhabdus bovienii str. Jollieti]